MSTAELLERMRRMESEIARLSADLARLRATPADTARPQEVRLARTYNTGSYPGGGSDNTFPATFVDGTFTETAGNQTPTITERDTGNVAIIHNTSDDYIPVNTLIPVWRQGGRWWTTYTTGSGGVTCDDLKALAGHSDSVYQVIVSAPGSPATCEWETVCELLDNALGAISSDLNGDIVAKKTDDSCGWATICDVVSVIADNSSAYAKLLGQTGAGACGWVTPCEMLQGLGGPWVANTWQMLIHNPQSGGSTTDDTCEWMTLCDFMGNAVGTLPSTDLSHVFAKESDGDCGWTTVCNILRKVDNWSDDTWQMLIHNPGPTSDSGVDDTCEWMTPCDYFKDSLSDVTADIVGKLFVKTDDGMGATSCGWASMCDFLKVAPTGYAVDTYQLMVHKPGTTDSGVDDTCEWQTPCEILNDSDAFPNVTSDITDNILVKTSDGGGPPVLGCGWATICDTLKVVADSAAAVDRVFGKTSSGVCGWFVPTGGGGDFCTNYKAWAVASSLDTSKEWVAKLVYTGGAWTCVAVEVETACT